MPEQEKRCGTCAEWKRTGRRSIGMCRKFGFRAEEAHLCICWTPKPEQPENKEE